MKVNCTNTQQQKWSRESELVFCPVPVYICQYRPVCTYTCEHAHYAEINHEQKNEVFVTFNTVRLYITLQLKYKLKPESLTRIKIYTYL